MHLDWPIWLQWFDACVFDMDKLNVFIGVAVISGIIIFCIHYARRGGAVFIRAVPGLQAVDDALGRAAELGRPVLFSSGLYGVDDIATLAGLNILGHLASRSAHYDTDLLVPCANPVVMTVAQELIKERLTQAGYPERYQPDHVCFITDEQFAYAGAVCGMMHRERPAAAFYLGSFAAESLLLAEAGADSGAIQVAGTADVSQIPFFIVACDYTLIGEELFAASAYLSRDALLLGSVKGQDYAKLLIMLLLGVGVVCMLLQQVTACPLGTWFQSLFTVTEAL
mgnify:CR=1 FL=1